MGEAEQVRRVYRGVQTVELRRQPEALDPTTRSGRPRRRKSGAVQLEVSAADLPLFEALRAWRREEASRQAVPPYVIFHDSTLTEIARDRPGADAALGRIGGVGQGKLDRYGAAVLAIVNQFG
jgi:ATP-dependent DNA helicase RecQ